MSSDSVSAKRKAFWATEVHEVYGDQDQRRLQLSLEIGRQRSDFLIDPLIVAVNRDHQRHQRQNQQSHYPGALGELGHEHGHDRCARRQSADPVDDHALCGTGPAGPAPVRHHPCLREREREKGADGVEGDQPVGHAAKGDQQECGEGGEHEDPLRIDQASSRLREGVRQVIVVSDGAAEARKVGEGGVGGERQDGQDRADRHVVEDPRPGDRQQQHREHALVSGRTRHGGADAVGRTRYAIPASSTMSSAMMIVNVRRAIVTTGSRNAFTPLLTASTPVMAVQPLAKAFSKSQMLGPRAGERGAAAVRLGRPGGRRAQSREEIPKRGHQQAADEEIGREHEKTPGSRTPRRLMIVTPAGCRGRAPACAVERGTADTRAPIPAEMPTATFRR